MENCTQVQTYRVVVHVCMYFCIYKHLCVYICTDIPFYEVFLKNQTHTGKKEMEV